MNDRIIELNAFLDDTIEFAGLAKLARRPLSYADANAAASYKTAQHRYREMRAGRKRRPLDDSITPESGRKHEMMRGVKKDKSRSFYAKSRQMGEEEAARQQARQRMNIKAWLRAEKGAGNLTSRTHGDAKRYLERLGKYGGSPHAGRVGRVRRK